MDDEDLLRYLRAAGTEDEPGAFTIDLARARARLRDYLLPQRAMYVLKLLQSAVLAGATTLDLKTSRDRVTIEHDGVAPNPSQLAALLSYVLPDSTSAPFLNPLATAANAAFSDEEVTDVTVDAFGGGRAYRLSLVSNDSTIRALDNSDKPRGVRFVMHRPRRVWDLFASWREPLLLAALGRFAPIVITVDGTEITGRPFGGGGEVALTLGPSWHYITLLEPGRSPRYFNKGFHIAEARFAARDDRGVGLPVGVAAHMWIGTWSDTGQLTYRPGLGQTTMLRRFHAALSLRTDTSLSPDISLVHDGVIVGHLHHASLPPGLEGVLAVDSGDTDASGLKITQAALRDLLPAVQSNASRLLEAISPQWHRRPLGDSLAELLTRNSKARLVMR